jgi:hypothetical protein
MSFLCVYVDLPHELAVRRPASEENVRNSAPGGAYYCRLSSRYQLCGCWCCRAFSGAGRALLATSGRPGSHDKKRKPQQETSPTKKKAGEWILFRFVGFASPLVSVEQPQVPPRRKRANGFYFGLWVLLVPWCRWSSRSSHQPSALCFVQ